MRKNDVFSSVMEVYSRYGILLPKLFWPTVWEKCSSNREKILKFETECRKFAKLLRSLEQFIQTVHCSEMSDKIW